MNNKYINTNISVRYAETDAMGVVHHSNYYIYFEKAREDLILSFGISYFEIEKMDIIMPITETYCKYLSPIKYGDIINIKSYVEKITPIKIEINYEISKISNTSDKKIAIGKTILAFVDKKTFKLINIKKLKPELWEKLNK